MATVGRRTLLQNAAIVITKCVTYYKMRRYFKMPQNSSFTKSFREKKRLILRKVMEEKGCGLLFFSDDASTVICHQTLKIPRDVRAPWGFRLTASIS